MAGWLEMERATKTQVGAETYKEVRKTLSRLGGEAVVLMLVLYCALARVLDGW
jgi:hypothetical protein